MRAFLFVLLCAPLYAQTFGGTLGGAFGVTASSVPTLTSPADTTSFSSGTTSVTIAWNAVSGAATYDYKVWTGSCGGTSFTSGNTASTTANIGSLANGTTYYWQVRTQNTYVSSAYSSCISFSISNSGVSAFFTANWAAASVGTCTNAGGDPFLAMGWDACTPPAAGTGLNLVSDAVNCPSGGKCAQIGYDNNTSSDMNYHVDKNLPTGSKHIFVKMLSNRVAGSGNKCGQGKHYYFKITPSDQTRFVVLTSDDANTIVGGCYLDSNHYKMKLDYSDASGADNASTANGSACYLAYSHSYEVAIEIQAASGASSNDGFINVWIDGVKDAQLSVSGLSIKSGAGGFDVGTGFGVVDAGAQKDPYDCNTLAPTTDSTEIRYQDAHVIYAYPNGAQADFTCSASGGHVTCQ